MTRVYSAHVNFPRGFTTVSLTLNFTVDDFRGTAACPRQCWSEQGGQFKTVQKHKRKRVNFCVGNLTNSRNRGKTRAFCIPVPWRRASAVAACGCEETHKPEGFKLKAGALMRCVSQNKSASFIQLRARDPSENSPVEKSSARIWDNALIGTSEVKEWSCPTASGCCRMALNHAANTKSTYESPAYPKRTIGRAHIRMD
eukprot:6446578-Pyramimonas_sp.AAC.1